MEPPDDAAVWRLDGGRALVLTTDFFTPVVDDPYDYGAIAAANSLSDIYAMGGEPFLALNIAALPPDLPPTLSAEILRGGAEKAREAGVVVAGGHTVQDKEPKYGLVALGFVNQEQIIQKGGAQPGDLLFLTKPLGFGVTTTALKQEKAAVDHVEEVVAWMKTLNRAAGQLARECSVRSGTDVTGYSLLGHGLEMTQASGCAFSIQFDRVPFVSGARGYAEMWCFPGGAADNRLHYEGQVSFADRLDEAARMLLFDPQTSGGLLLAVPRQKADAFTRLAEELRQPVWRIGEVHPGRGIQVV